MELLRNAVRPYAWGSRTIIPELLGRPVPAPHPEAELWMGAHPGDPSRITRADGTERTLLEIVDADPVGQLGARCAEQWGNRLPFLLKILAIEEPLSMQAHPSAAQAAEGFRREEAAGIARGAANRNYPDPTAKPELVCALTEFHALAGFRDPARTVEFLREIDTPGLTRYTELLAAQPDADGLRALFTTWITLPQRTLDALLPEVLDACVLHLKNHGRFDVECRTVLELGEAHPHDAAVLAALLLNRMTLHAGDALFLPAGNLHLYLHGAAVEILANSDNILRGGLTPKHVDVPELLRVLDFGCPDMPVLRGGPIAPGERLVVYRTEAAEFELSSAYWAAGEDEELELGCSGPQILLCVEGALDVVCPDGGPARLRRGESAWLAADDPAVTVRPADGAPARLYRATAGGC
ncbi:mannose-6-phosphate isomerase, class I [Amycolatopsis antarctica]|uniref:mannose-6-phosphate isomerase n=1 Tax=Amycolatopsis antarctica TaxID=1854586 RepID=A0A263D805_9PSEU|nr:mannose-6-phosphate isomerase, class I [Amycolatopsis antarctica]OZM73687.1 mannose-6-phosphate isomerase, class I [Amycolatopsis antarctica]